MTREEALALDRVSLSYGDLRALDGLSLTVNRAEVFGLLGPNGAGKTTLVSVAVGLLKPDSGAARLGGGGDPLDPPARSGIGLAPQDLALYDELTARENLDFFGRIQGMHGGELRERRRWCLDFAGLADRAGDQVGGFSGGMKRRLNLAAALVHDPPLLLLDEPTVGVDPQSRNAIFEKIELLRAEGRTILYTTHYMEEAQRLCDRVAIIDRGRLLALDTVPALIAAHGGKSALKVRLDGEELRSETEDPLAELERLRGLGRLERFRLEGPDLESVFLNLTGRQLRD